MVLGHMDTSAVDWETYSGAMHIMAQIDHTGAYKLHGAYVFPLLSSTLRVVSACLSTAYWRPKIAMILSQKICARLR